MAEPKQKATYVLAGAMVILAVALVYFSFTLAKVVTALPGLLTQIEAVGGKIDPIVDEVGEIRLLVPDIVDQVSQIEERIPALLAEIEAIRLSLPAVLDEAAAYREQIPVILEEAKAIRAALPAILDELEAYRAEIPSIVAQFEGIQAQIPLIIEQVEAIRAELPEHLDQAERISLNIEEAGKSAGEGAVTGVFTGLIKAPMTLVTGIGDSVIGGSELNQQERLELVKAAEHVLKSGKVGDRKEWRVRSTGTRGSVTIMDLDESGDFPCVTLSIQVEKGKKPLPSREYVVCQTAEGTWELQEER
jgi:regulator of replication initiation timing